MIESTCMTNSKKSAPNKIRATELLDLPDAPDFVSVTPEVSLEDNIKLCEQMLEVWNKDRFEKLKELPIITEDFYL